MSLSSVISLIIHGEDQASGALGAVQSKIGGLDQVLGGLAVAGGTAAVVALAAVGGAALSTASQVDQATNMIQAQLGLTQDEARELGAVATDVFANNFAGSIEEAGAAVAIVSQQLDSFGVTAETGLQQATEAAIALQDAFGVEISESVNTARALMDNFGLTSQEAFNFITKGMQLGLNASGDFLDSIGEYSSLFSEGGATAQNFFSVMETGLQSGVLGTDKAADLFKEFFIRIKDGSDTTHDALTSLGLDADAVTSGLADGSITAVSAWNQVRAALANTDDGLLQFQSGVALMGTQFEDLGASAVLAIDPLSDSFKDVSGSVESLNVQYNNFGSLLEGVKRRAQVALLPLGEVLLDLANRALPVVMDIFENRVMPVLVQVGTVAQQVFAGDLAGALESVFGSEIAGKITTVADTISGFVSDPLLPFIQSHLPELKGALIAIGAVLGGAAIVSGIVAIGGAIATLLSPVGLVVAAVGVLGAAWAGNWGGIQEKTAAVIEFVKGIISSGLEAIQSWWSEHGDAIIAAAETAWSAIQSVVETVTEILKSVFAAFKSAFESDWQGFGENLRVAWDAAWEAIKGVVSAAWEAIKGIVSSLVDDVITFFTTTNWKQLGDSVIDGIISGLQSGAQAVIDFVVGIASNAVDAIKGFFGIDSPSRLMADIFGNVLEGAIVGMSGMRPRVVSQAEDVSAAVAGALAIDPPAVHDNLLLYGSLPSPSPSVTSSQPVQVVYQFSPNSVVIHDQATGRIFLDWLRAQSLNLAMSEF